MISLEVINAVLVGLLACVGYFGFAEFDQAVNDQTEILPILLT